MSAIRSAHLFVALLLFVCMCVCRITKCMCIHWPAMYCTRRPLWNTMAQWQVSNILRTDQCWLLATRTAKCFCISCLTTLYVLLSNDLLFCNIILYIEYCCCTCFISFMQYSASWAYAVTRLPSNLRLTTRKCMHVVMHGHFWSRDKDGGHTIIRSAIAENPMLCAYFMGCLC